jgi:hypothetical protein
MSVILPFATRGFGAPFRFLSDVKFALTVLIAESFVLISSSVRESAGALANASESGTKIRVLAFIR